MDRIGHEERARRPRHCDTVVEDVSRFYPNNIAGPRAKPQNSVWPNSWTFTKTNHRRSQYIHQGGKSGHHFAGDSWATLDFRGHRFQRQFSEDSGFSSCGSSASSIADDSDSISGFSISTNKALDWYNAALTRNRIIRARYGSQSGTVAAVLAAAITSDSEETDAIESEEEGFVNAAPFAKGNAPENTRTCLHPVATNIPSFSSSTKSFSQRGISGQDQLQFYHSGRDILDLGSNMQTKFPFRASELPERNLHSFLQNRSQYHRLGKFGTSEVLCYATCRKRCGFSFPVPDSRSQVSQQDANIEEFNSKGSRYFI